MTSPSGPPQGAGGFPGPGQPQGYTGGPQQTPPASPGPQAEVHTLERAIFEVKRIIVGQDQLLERMLVGLLAKGHVLLEGVPGVAKTLAVETFAKVVGGSFARIQFTPDLVPTDIVGTRIYRVGKEDFETELGPVMVNFLLADEINRAPAKVQSALLEVMAEHHLSIGGSLVEIMHPSPGTDSVDVGPLVSEDARKSVAAYLDGAIAEGAEVVTKRTEVPSGPYLAPTLLDRVTPDMTVAREEVFGPVLAVIRVADAGEAIRVANDSEYGLAGSIFTRDIATALRYANQLDTGMVHVNHGTSSQAHVPFGGAGASGLGPYSIGHAAQDFFTKVKVMYVSS